MLINQDIAVIKEVSFSILDDCVYVETPIAYWKIYTTPLRPRLVVDHKHKGNQKEWHNQGGLTVFNPDYDGFWRAMDYIIQHDWDYKRVSKSEPMLISVKDRSKHATTNPKVKKSNDEKIEDTLRIFNSKKNSPNIDVSVYEDPEHKGYFCTEIKFKSGLLVSWSDHEEELQQKNYEKKEKELRSLPETLYVLSTSNKFGYDTNRIYGLLQSNSDIYAHIELGKTKSNEIVLMAKREIDKLISPLVQCAAIGINVEDSFQIKQYVLVQDGFSYYKCLSEIEIPHDLVRAEKENLLMYKPSTKNEKMNHDKKMKYYNSIPSWLR